MLVRQVQLLRQTCSNLIVLVCQLLLLQVGQYRGQSAVAVGYSRLSDNGKYGVKFSLGANTQGNVGAGAGVAYFW